MMGRGRRRRRLGVKYGVQVTSLYMPLDVVGRSLAGWAVVTIGYNLHFLSGHTPLRASSRPYSAHTSDRRASPFFFRKRLVTP